MARRCPRAYAGGDVMVFPSLTDTFGLVMLESLACGTPVAAFPVTGPKDVLAAGGAAVGAVDDDLRAACLAALAFGDRAACREYAQTYSWQACAERFFANLVPIHHGISLSSQERALAGHLTRFSCAPVLVARRPLRSGARKNHAS